MKDTITLAELRKTELYRKEQTRPLREFLMENIEVLKLADEVEMWGEDLLALNMRGGIPVIEGARLLRQQQAEIEALKKSCLDEIFKRTYANQSAKVMEGYWQEAQAEIEALKLQLHTTLTNRDLRTYDGKTEINNEPLELALRKAQENG